MKISIITVCYNSELTIKDTIESVLNQTYSDIEYIVIDGASKDKTVEIIKSYGDRISYFISEPDKGMYNALNKGIRIASGDVLGILNADDFFTSKTIVERIAFEFLNNDIDALYGDVQFVKPNDLNKVVRYFSSKRFHSNKFKYGFMPAHPSFYVRRSFFEKLGLYKEDYVIGSDYELLIRFLYNKGLKYKYVDECFVTMRTGGVSNKNINSRFLLNKEVVRACKENNINTNLLFIYSKYFFKIFEYLRLR